MTAAYDTFQSYYDDTRRADPGITDSLIDLLAPNNSGCYLDLACGTGNYNTAVSSQGFMLYGVNQSEKILTTARQKSTNVQWF
jgi:ubiquinone/menaquinone biosynthesis C-methylase UbiE